MDSFFKKFKKYSAPDKAESQEDKNKITITDQSRNLDYALYYVSVGLSVVPLVPKDKVPIIEWKPYQERLPTEEEVRKWFRDPSTNIAIITGAVSGNLVGIDFDDPNVYTDFADKLFYDPILGDKAYSTWITKTGKGYHIYFRIDVDKGVFKQIFRQKIDIEGKHIDMKAEGGYFVAPPSIHPSGSRYEFLAGPPMNKEPAVLSLKEWERLLKLLGVEPWEGLLRILNAPDSATPGNGKAEQRKEQSASQTPRNVSNCKKLGEKEILRIEELLEPYYVEGHRDYIIMYTLGEFVKNNICRDIASRFVELLSNNTKDPEKNNRLYLVDYHYDERVKNPGIAKLKGLRGVREEIENVLRGKGEPEDVVVQKASGIVAEIASILGTQKGSGGVAWLRRKGKQILKWVSVGKQGIYVFSRAAGDDDPVVAIVSHAKISGVRTIKIIGLDFRDYYSVDLEGEKIIGTIDEIIDVIKKRYGIEAGQQYAVARLIDYMAEEEEELYYSPGPWVVGSKIAFAREPGYTPTWKKYVRWNVRADDPGEEMVRKALETIKNLVMSYRDPSKPSTVLSYAVVSVISVYIKEKLSIFPHLLIHGLNESGKSVLLDSIKLLFNINWSDEIPGTEYQARLILTPSTLPAIVDEMGGVLTGKNAQGVLGVLHDSATKITMRISGGHEYAGYYLGVRSLIGATNTDISLLPWQIDKFIFVEISRKEAIDISKARGSTPRSMDPNIKLAVQYVGYLLLKGLEGKLGEIDKLKELPRDELKKRILEIGYSVWVDLYRQYGLEPFPPPSEGENKITQTTIEEEYKDLFISYVRRCLSKPQNNLPLIVVHGENSDIEEDTDALKDLETYGAIIDKNTNEVIMKTTFLSGFSQWAEKEYKLQPLGWQRLEEILDLTETRRKIGGKTMGHLLVFKIDFI
uniref:RepA n=1 Tax=Saccharolobus solfataricus TaxID=2287 RepID=Q6PN91_SACSO|nr:bifunctional DNA primase/polymerase [Saccharolobus solfataricus]AAT00521.1 RepA [Saccharolobus solfataricus]